IVSGRLSPRQHCCACFSLTTNVASFAGPLKKKKENDGSSQDLQTLSKVISFNCPVDGNYRKDEKNLDHEAWELDIQTQRTAFQAAGSCHRGYLGSSVVTISPPAEIKYVLLPGHGWQLGPGSC
ncbi:hypothetical protein OIU85_022992, partial [Salix viminalis]